MKQSSIDVTAVERAMLNYFLQRNPFCLIGTGWGERGNRNPLSTFDTLHIIAARGSFSSKKQRDWFHDQVIPVAQVNHRKNKWKWPMFERPAITLLRDRLRALEADAKKEGVTLSDYLDESFAG